MAGDYGSQARGAVRGFLRARRGRAQPRRKALQREREENDLYRCKLWLSGDALQRLVQQFILEGWLTPDPAALAQTGTLVFMFQEGNDRAVQRVFREIAELTRGAYCRFDSGAARSIC